MTRNNVPLPKYFLTLGIGKKKLQLLFAAISLHYVHQLGHTTGLQTLLG